MSKRKKKKKVDKLTLVNSEGEDTGLYLTAEECIELIGQFYASVWNKMVNHDKEKGE